MGSGVQRGVGEKLKDNPPSEGWQIMGGVGPFAIMHNRRVVVEDRFPDVNFLHRPALIFALCNFKFLDRIRLTGFLDRTFYL